MRRRRSPRETPPLDELNVRLVEIFCCVYEERSISRAAARLALSQPTVSGHLKALEEAFATPMFDRIGHRIEPNAAGHHFYTHARALVAHKRELLAAMARFLNRAEGTLRLGASSVPGELVLPGLIRGFREAHPKLAIQLFIRGTREVAQRVAAGEVDLAWVGGAWSDPELEFRPMGTDRLVMIAPKRPAWGRLAARLALADLPRIPLVVREAGSGTRALLESSLAASGMRLASLTIAAELGSAGAIREAVASGLGAAFVSDVSVRSGRLAAGARTVALDGLAAPMERTFHLVTSRERSPSPLRDGFEAYLRASWPARAAGGAGRSLSLLVR